mmetsp:Transcript_11554/g.13982  ORF Transcript_11554/g.13982 Transcript_11554/m.13982 type:complete len:315 (+) Transcript_11554:107-1051(+)
MMYRVFPTSLVLRTVFLLTIHMGIQASHALLQPLLLPPTARIPSPQSEGWKPAAMMTAFMLNNQHHYNSRTQPHGIKMVNNFDNDDDEEEKEYARKKAEAEKAIAAAEEARQKLQAKQKLKSTVSKVRSLEQQQSQTKPRQPTLTRSTISRSDAGTLQIDISPNGVGSNTIFSGAFSAAWFSAIVPATLASGGAGALFMLPFWAAGGLVAKTAVVDPFIAGKLTIGQYAWELESTYIAGATIKKKEGPTEQLKGCTVELVAVVNGVPQYELRLFSSTKGGISFGIGLPEEELDYLAEEINHFLANLPEDIEPMF